MRHSLIPAAALLLFIAPLLAQQPPQPPRPTPSVQVGVPEGRGGAPAAPQGGAGRGRQAGPAQPAPRSADGRILLGGATPKETGVWLPGGTPVNEQNRPQVPLQPWARALLVDRDANELEPHTRCKPSGVARPFLTPYGVEFVVMPELERVYIFDIGGPHTYRTIYMDGRTHPKDGTRTFYGHSIGWWDKDTLVVDTDGFNEGFWLDRLGTPHTEKLHTLERITRTDHDSVRYELTIDDPDAYTKPWSTSFNLRWAPDVELFEYVCQQANYAHELMVGQHESVDRSSSIIP